jgi:hypothetical protein
MRRLSRIHPKIIIPITTPNLMDIPDFPNVSKSAVAYLTQAMTELATEQGFKPNDQAEMEKWMNDNYQAIIERSQDLQMAFFNKCQEHHEAIVKVLSTKIWGEVRRTEIDRQVKQSIDDALL